MEFYDAVPTTSSWSQEELDRIAATTGVVRSIGYGYARLSPPPRDQHGYAFRWVNTRGMGNHGALVLIPRSQRAYEIVRARRVRELAELLGCSTAEADRWVSASRQCHGSEPDVVRVAYALAHRVPEWDLERAPSVGAGIGRWIETMSRQYALPQLPQITCPRLDSAISIACRFLGLTRGIG